MLNMLMVQQANDVSVCQTGCHLAVPSLDLRSVAAGF